ncbi:MAG: hypothetical protein NZ921_02315 [Candidatus Caldarchaeum sp.]|nr:hypothetical protein [Candidatus Caldarchaeum sp.]
MAESIAFRISKDSFLMRILTTTILNAGARVWLDRLEKYFTRLGREYERAIDKAKTCYSVKTSGTDFNKLRQHYKAMKVPAQTAAKL